MKDGEIMSASSTSEKSSPLNSKKNAVMCLTNFTKILRRLTSMTSTDHPTLLSEEKKKEKSWWTEKSSTTTEDSLLHSMHHGLENLQRNILTDRDGTLQIT